MYNQTEREHYYYLKTDFLDMIGDSHCEYQRLKKIIYSGNINSHAKNI